VLENGKLKPDLAKKGIRHLRFGAPSVTFTYFNLDDPVVGGYSTAQVALRRAIGMGFDIGEFIKVLYAGSALPANQLLPPGVNGHDPSLPPNAVQPWRRARLDRFGFRTSTVTAIADPDAPLTVVRGTLPGRGIAMRTLWKRTWTRSASACRSTSKRLPVLNLSRAGKLPMFNLLPVARAFRLQTCRHWEQGAARRDPSDQASRARRRIRGIPADTVRPNERRWPKMSARRRGYR
jgi:hypothetical protein